MIHPLILRTGRLRAADDAGLAAALAAPPRDFAVACRAALEELAVSREGFDAERALREIAIALTDQAGGSRRAMCDAPNCAGHRTRP
jgi:hypothetical protein